MRVRAAQRSPADRRTTSERPAQPHPALTPRAAPALPAARPQPRPRLPAGRCWLPTSWRWSASALVSLAAADEGVTLAVALYALIFAGSGRPRRPVRPRPRSCSAGACSRRSPRSSSWPAWPRSDSGCSQDLAWSADVGAGPAGLLWLLSGATVIRWARLVRARNDLGRVLPAERCLVIGGEAEAETLATRLTSSSTPQRRGGAAAAARRVDGPRAGALARTRRPRSRTSVEKHRVERVIVAPGARRTSDDDVLDADPRRWRRPACASASCPRLLDIVGAPRMAARRRGRDQALLGVPPYGLSRSGRVRQAHRSTSSWP